MEYSDEKASASSVTAADSAVGTISAPVSPSSVSSSENSQATSLRHEIRVWTRDLLIAIGLALVIIVFLYQPVKVEGTSMAPLLSDQERIFINKFVYRFESIHRGDVVVFWYPLDRSKSFIKASIGKKKHLLDQRPPTGARMRRNRQHRRREAWIRRRSDTSLCPYRRRKRTRHTGQNRRQSLAFPGH